MAAPAAASAAPTTASIGRVGFGGRRLGAVYERNLRVYRRAWQIIFSGFFEPLFYLLSIGLGIGALVGKVSVAGTEVPYREFVAPALLATSAMNGAVYESTMNIFFKLKFAKIYDAMLATPLQVGDIALGELGWCLTRGALYAGGFLVVVTGFGLVHSWWALMALPASVLIGFAFAAVGMASTTFMRSWADFDMVQAVIMPLFLFSATFFPLSTYPDGLQWVVRCTPLYQGVDLLRALLLGNVGIDALGHVAYLTAMGATGLFVVRRRLAKLLLA
jgi:lipooligosaccharide transport system permease protein